MRGAPRFGSLSSSITGPPGQPVVMFGGLLTSSNVTELLSTTAKVVQEGPESIIIDLTRLRVTDRLHLTSLITVSHRAAAWPGCPIALCVVDERTREALRRLGVDRYMPLCHDADEARRRLGVLPPALRLREHLLPTLHSVELARARAHDACAQWGATDIEDKVQSVVTELVVNAVMHARTPVELTFARRQPFFYVTVHDQSDRLPRRLTDGEDHGYGLTVVDALASHWGSHFAPGGKVVWAAIRLPARRPERSDAPDDPVE